MDNSNNYVTLYNSMAHVFQVNPETKNSWLAKGDQAIPIAFVATLSQPNGSEPAKRELKIIGTNDKTGETVLDTVILPETTFNKRSQKFGQWVDPFGMVYGLGFNSETELLEFVGTLQQLQRDILTTPQQQQQGDVSDNLQSQSSSMLSRVAGLQQLNLDSETNGRSEVDGRVSANRNMQQYSNNLSHAGYGSQQIKRQPVLQGVNSMTNNKTSLHENSNGNRDDSNNSYPRSQSMFGLQTQKQAMSNDNNNNTSLVTGKLTPDIEYSPTSQNENIQLKYQNERLRQALEQSSKNANIWHSELVNLRTNNVKLTQALQESKAHVQEWERELLSVRDENKELKLRIKALESANDPEKSAEYKKDLQKYKSSVENELRKRENEIEDLKHAMEEMQIKSKVSSQNGSQIDVADNTLQKQKLEQLGSKLENKMSEIMNVYKELSQLVNKMYH